VQIKLLKCLFFVCLFVIDSTVLNNKLNILKTAVKIAKAAAKMIVETIKEKTEEMIARVTAGMIIAGVTTVATVAMKKEGSVPHQREAIVAKVEVRIEEAIPVDYFILFLKEKKNNICLHLVYR
jgi:hypothetical protein